MEFNFKRKTIKRKKQNMTLLFVMFFLSVYLEVFSQTINNIHEMNTIQFIPQEFENIKLGYYESAENACTPAYKSKPVEFMINKILINAPQKIIYYPSDSNFKPIVPICGVYMITSRRGLKYAHLSAQMLHIRKVGYSDWHSGEIVAPNLQYEHPALPPNFYEDQKETEQEIKEAQKYSDEELNQGQASGSAININLMEYVNVELSSGLYEIYLSFNGLESNRVIVEIIFKENPQNQDTQPEK